MNKIKYGIKKQTIRLNVAYWLKVFNSTNKLDIWWLNPRNQHPDCYKMGVASGEIKTKYGKDLTDEDAFKDGFDSLGELLETLMMLHHFTKSEVLGRAWVVVLWVWSYEPVCSGGAH
jgi:hypothetical protein